jgi:hypothetical protein
VSGYDYVVAGVIAWVVLYGSRTAE